MVIVAIVGLLAAIAVTNVMIARDNGRLTTIRRNLRTVEDAKVQWAADNGQPDGAPVADITVLSDYFRGGSVRHVVQEVYVPNAIGTPAVADLPAGMGLGPYAPGSSIPAQ